MRGPRTLEILGIADRLPGKRLAHRNGVEHEITQKHPYGEDKQGGIGVSIPGAGLRKSDKSIAAATNR